jgi:hypothetical protein
MNKRRRHTKERDTFIQATTAREVDHISLEFRLAGDQISFTFGQPMIHAYHQTQYARAKGPKVLSRIPLGSAALDYDPNTALRNNYDLLVAVDTNTIMFAGRPVSVSAVVASRWVNGPDGPAFLPRLVCCLEFTIRNTPPELAGWTQALRELRERKYLHEGQRVALLVDSELGNLEAYNRRQRPMANGAFLPEGVTFVYASADSGVENVANRLMRTSDDVARQILTKIKSGQIPVAEERPFGPFNSFRYIVPRT